MNKAFDLIVERLEEKALELYDDELGEIIKKEDSIEIVKQVAEEYKDFEIFTKEQLANIEQMNVDTFERLVKLNKTNDGWIPCSERLPESSETLIVSFKDRFLTQGDGTCEGWYDSTNKMWNLSEYEYSDNVEVIAWRERLKPYQRRESK